VTDTNPADAGVHPGDRTYRAWVGAPERYDLMAAAQFSLLTHLGLREHHTLLDLGCGSLRGGRLFIPYLLPDRYFGIEPERWVLEEGIRNVVGQDQIDLKRPTFSHVDDFRLTVFGRRFDFILAQSIFSHASRAQIEFALSQAAEALEPGGALVATFLEGDEDYPGTEWVYPDCIPYRPATIREMVEAAGLTFADLHWPHPNLQRWFVASRPGGEPLANAARVETYAGLRDQLKESQEALARIGRHPAYRAYRSVRRLFRRRR
jgi:SAM-dependent methyltransferase